MEWGGVHNWCPPLSRGCFGVPVRVPGYSLPVGCVPPPSPEGKAFLGDSLKKILKIFFLRNIAPSSEPLRLHACLGVYYPEPERLRALSNISLRCHHRPPSRHPQSRFFAACGAGPAAQTVNLRLQTRKRFLPVKTKGQSLSPLR